MSSSQVYDVAIIGGGLAGLSLAIVLARQQYNVLLLEKESYPKHKVCGEYISQESLPFLHSLGLDTSGLPIITRVQITDTKNNQLNAALPQGGIGISRYMLDDALAKLATAAGATVLTKTKVDNVVWNDGTFSVSASNTVFTARVACGAWGKRSNVDVKWHRPFLSGRSSALSNYVGIKHHIRYPWPADLVGLYNFTGGYCGISSVEEGRVCLCYLTTAAALHSCGNNIGRLEQEVLRKNRVLDDVFATAEMLYDHPLAISQISFMKKEQVQDHVLLLGDAAGMITPLCGNGMSMALHSAKLAAAVIDNYLQRRTTMAEMEAAYIAAWKRNFSLRTTLGRMVQRGFGKDNTTALFLRAFHLFPPLQQVLIRGTSGRPF